MCGSKSQLCALVLGVDTCEHDRARDRMVAILEGESNDLRITRFFQTVWVLLSIGPHQVGFSEYSQEAGKATGLEGDQ